jgi:3',5'-cyclic AMP phosphodiesterase CpdA
VALRFLHTSDVHLLDLQGVRPWRYLGKRMTGRLNLALHRRRRHDPVLFDAMMEQIPVLRIERVVVTGDLSNLSLESEFAHVRVKLDALPVPCTIIPGNHDAYTAGIVRDRVFERYLGHHMDGQRLDGADYPFMERHAPDVAVIGVSTAVATRPFVATGLIGAPQLDRLGRMLRVAALEQRFRVVLIHHPPVTGVSKRLHDLLDQAAFADVIAQYGAELVLHGHEHRRVDSELVGPDGGVPVHGISSGTSLSPLPQREACFSIYEVCAAGMKRELYVWNGNAFEKHANVCSSTSPVPPC